VVWCALSVVALRRRNPLMGWTSSADPMQSVRLEFDSKDAAVRYCQNNAHDFVIEGERVGDTQPKSYATNFVPKTAQTAKKAEYD
jgi:NADH dehydrogenase (ubiquinone) Fe-S protein 4